jgi:hypothetical protein
MSSFGEGGKHPKILARRDRVKARDLMETLETLDDLG